MFQNVWIEKIFNNQNYRPLVATPISTIPIWRSALFCCFHHHDADYNRRQCDRDDSMTYAMIALSMDIDRRDRASIHYLHLCVECEWWLVSCSNGHECCTPFPRNWFAMHAAASGVRVQGAHDRNGLVPCARVPYRFAPVPVLFHVLLCLVDQIDGYLWDKMGLDIGWTKKNKIHRLARGIWWRF